MEYETFIARETLIQDGEPVDLLIRDREQFQSRLVRALVHRDASRSTDQLWVFTPLGVLMNQAPWAIQIIEETDEESGGEERFHKCDSFGKK